MAQQTQTNQAAEWGYTSGKSYSDPFNKIELDVVFTDPDGQEQRVPAFWAGGSEWRVRFAPRLVGDYQYRTVCSDKSNTDLHGQEGTLQTAPYEGDNPLLQHGPFRVTEDKHHFEHRDGTPFFWLGDTGWMSLCKRLAWPEDFQRLYSDRKAKGFSVVQIIMGLYPDMPAFDPRGANEAGFPWTEDYARINPAYYDMADRRIQWLVEAGLAPCIVGCWAYFLPWMGVENLQKHWRYLIARYGAYPVFWCLAGESGMPYYLSENPEKDAAAQKHGWSEIGRYVRETDPFHHPVTIHPSKNSRSELDDPSVLDFEMLQTGHPQLASVTHIATATARLVNEAVQAEPHIPVIDAEPGYEGIFGSAGADSQRFYFWACLLSGTAGHTYGANGIWQLNTRAQPYGPSPHGSAWGDTPWEEAYQLPGAQQVALGKKILERYEWWRFAPHQHWALNPAGKQDSGANPASEENYFRPYAAGIPREVRFVYYWMLTSWSKEVILRLEEGVRYTATFIDPSNGKEYPLGAVEAVNGEWPVPIAPAMHDWVLVFDALGQASRPHTPGD